MTNVRNNADTFSPYNPNTIVSNTPWVGAPLPLVPTVWEQTLQQMAPYVGMATSMGWVCCCRDFAPWGLGIAAAAGDFVNQSFQIGSGPRPGVTLILERWKKRPY